MVFLFLPSGGGKLKDQIMVQKTRIWSFKIRMRMDVSRPGFLSPQFRTGVLRAPQRASGASSGKRETTSAPPWAAPRNARRRDAEARGPSRARVPAPTCVWVNPQTEPFEGRGKTKRTSDSIDDIESNPERPEILDESPSSAQALSTTHKPFSN